MKIAPVILAGGAGTRLWPLSSEERPKQFHNLTGGGTLLEETIKRLLPINPDMFIIATSKKYEKMSLDEFKAVGAHGRVLVEPRPKNTAAAVLYSAIYLSKIYKESIMIILPSDHYIKKKNAFVNIIKKGLKEAGKDKLVSIGIKPTYAETGYGYIKGIDNGKDILPVERFVEKPDKQTAEKYVADGSYFWNSGIFVWKTSVILENFQKLMPALYKNFAPLIKMDARHILSNEDKIFNIKDKVFSSIESVSIDYGIMEKAENKVVIPSDFCWTDLGSWYAIDEILKPDENCNRTPDIHNSIFVSAKNCSVFSEGKTIALIGVENLVVAESGDCILVMNKNDNQEVRKVVEIVRKTKQK